MRFQLRAKIYGRNATTEEYVDIGKGWGWGGWRGARCGNRIESKREKTEENIKTRFICYFHRTTSNALQRALFSIIDLNVLASQKKQKTSREKKTDICIRTGFGLSNATEFGMRTSTHRYGIDIYTTGNDVFGKSLDGDGEMLYFMWYLGMDALGSNRIPDREYEHNAVAFPSCFFFLSSFLCVDRVTGTRMIHNLLSLMRLWYVMLFDDGAGV